MAKQKLTALDLRLKKLAVLSQAYTDDKAAGEKVYLYDSAVTESGTTEGYLKTYYLAAGAAAFSAITDDNLIGTIDIPKDYLVKSAKTITVQASGETGKWEVIEENGQAVTPYEAPSTVNAAGLWLDFVINTKDASATDSHVCINVSSLIDTYTGGNGIDIDSNNKISIDLATNGGLEFSGDTEGTKTLKAKVNEENGLSITESGITMSLAEYTPASGETPASGNAGAMSSDDKRVVDESNTDLLIDNELGSWFGLTSAQTQNLLSGVTDDSITDDPSGSSVEFIDLGLTSGIKWANMNLGAEAPEEYGAYFDWGNVTPHYPIDDSFEYNFNKNAYGGHYNDTPGGQLTGDIPVNATYDAARALLGGTSRMPTSAETQELYDETDSEWVSDFNGTGVAGRKFMKKSDHSVFIFLPAAGGGNGTSLNSASDLGYYWTSSYYDESMAHCLDFNSYGDVGPWNTSSRYFGYSVRAVQD